MLAGGTSRRFRGAAKGLHEVGGRRIIDRVADVLRAVTPDLRLAANDPASAGWLPGVAVLADRYPHAGGLAGVEAALAGGHHVLVVAWDMPFVSAAVLEAIVAKAGNEDADVVVPESISPFGFEPFCAFYSTRVAGALASFLAHKPGAPRDFLAQVSRVHRLTLPEIERLGDPRQLFMSVNTPEDLARARAMVDATE